MISKIIQNRIKDYGCNTQQEFENAVAEISQEIALAGLSRSNFFSNVAFQGGTCLRILYGMPRFSEDLDFISKKNSEFEFNEHFSYIKREFEAYGIDILVEDRTKADETIKKAFLKTDSFGKILLLEGFNFSGRLKTIKIKLEIDINPPRGSSYEIKYLDFPFPFAVTVQDAPSLFAGKSHALLCREYVKGRDWFDFSWYVGRKTQINYTFLSNSLNQVGPWRGQNISFNKDWYLKHIEEKISSVDWDVVKNDVIRFLKTNDIAIVKLWSQDYFMNRLQKLAEYLE